MSIYKSKFKPPEKPEDVTQTVRTGARAAPAGVHPIVAHSASELAKLRKAKPVDYLLPASVKWFASLPTEVRPEALVRRYPRIANCLALEWGQPAACTAYFDKLFDQRQRTRRGFPPDVHRELRALREHYLRIHLSVAG